MKPVTFSSTDLQLLQRQLDSWRHQQTRRHRLPTDLWAAAAALGRAHGVSRVSRLLGLSFLRLRHECQRQPAPPPIPGRFIELKLDAASLPGTPTTGWVELIGGADRRMRVHTGHDPAAWVALARAFWEGGS